MQERNPCSGCGRERRMISTSAAVESGLPLYFSATDANDGAFLVVVAV